MAKRISCFVLALVMVVLAVPAFVMPAAAEAKTPYTTKWTDNLPQVDNSADLSVVKYPTAAWTVGTKMSGSNPSATAYQEFEQYTAGGGASKLIRIWGGSEWGSGGFYAGAYTANLTQLFITPAATAIRYIAEYSGSATVTLDSLFFDDKSSASEATGKSNVAFAVLVNGEMVWPNKGADCFADETKWYNPGEKIHTNLASEIGEIKLDLKAGDYVEFTFRKLSNAQGSWGAYKVAPIVTYTEMAEVQPHTTAWLDYVPNVSHTTNEVALFDGPWTVGRIVNGIILPYDRHQSGGEQIILNSDHTGDIWGWSGMWTGYKEFGTRTMVINVNTTLAVGYTAEYTGTATATIRNILFRTENSAFAVTVNGKYVFPANATDDKATWFKTTELNANSGSEIGALKLDLKQGDEVRFLFKGDGWAFANFDPVITYENVAGQERLTNAYAASNFTKHGKIEYGSDSGPLFFEGFKADAELVAQYCGGATEDEAELLAGYKAYLTAVMPTASAINFPGAWSTGAIQPDGSYDKIAGRLFFVGKTAQTATAWDWQWAVTQRVWDSVFKDFLADKNTGAWASHGGVMKYNGGNLSTLTEPSDSSTLYAYAYEVPQDGYAKFMLKGIDNASVDMLFAIYVDGYMVWPTVGGGYTDNSAYHTIPAHSNSADYVNSLNATLADATVYVREGALIQFVVRKTEWGNGTLGLNPSVRMYETDAEKAIVTYTEADGKIIKRFESTVGDKFPMTDVLATWDIDGDSKKDTLPKTVEGDITVTALSYVGREDFADDFPTVTDGAAVFHGDWTIGHGTWSSSDMTDKSITWTKTELFSKWDGWALVGNAGGLWDAAGGGWYTSGKFASKSAPNGMGAIYTAPMTGYVDLAYDVLTGSREINQGDKRETQAAPIAYYIAIVKNGKVIWPADGGMFLLSTQTEYTGNQTQINFLTTTDIATAIPELPKNLYVEEGDEIAFIVNAGNDLSWMFYMEPVVTYTALATEPEEPTVPEIESGSVTLNDKFAANFNLDTEALPEGATNIGAYINDEFVAAANGTVTLGGIAAKELADSITVQPAYTVDGTEVKGEETTVTVASMLMQYVNGDNAEAKALAIATLNYAAAAQTYFDYNTENLANAGLSDEQKALTYANTYADGHKITGEGAAVTVYGIKLMLNDTADIAVYFNSELDLANGYTAICKNGDATYSVKFVKVENSETLYKAIFEGFMPTAWDADLEFSVTDGEKTVSETLTYSVTDYCFRMQGSAIDAVVDAMLALYEAADAYTDTLK